MISNIIRARDANKTKLVAHPVGIGHGAALLGHVTEFILCSDSQQAESEIFVEVCHSHMFV